MQKDRQEFLEQLMSMHGPSGFEEKAQDVVRRRMADCAEVVRTDVHGNVLGGVNVTAPLRVMLAGHVDEIGLMVTYIDDNGYIFFQCIGGFDTNVLTGQRVLIHTADGPLVGLIGRKPIHVLTPEERKEAPKIESLFIDIGAKNAKDAAKHVAIGDPITLDAGLKYLLNDLVACRGFDDRCGAFVVIETLRVVAKAKPKVALWSVSTVQEEVGLRGAHTSAFGIDPHVGIAVDVGFATDFPGMEKKQYGDNKVGCGPLISRGPNTNPVVFEGLVATAKAKKIPYQCDPAPRPPGTDANAIQLNRAGVATGLVSVPNRYMHSPNELVSLKDLDHAIDLLSEYVLSLRPEDTFIPGQSKARKGKK